MSSFAERGLGIARPISDDRFRRLGNLCVVANTIAPKNQLTKLVEELQSIETEARVRAASAIEKLASKPGCALDVASHTMEIVRRTQEDEDVSVRLAALGTLRTLVERGHISSVAIHARDFIDSLKDLNFAVRRKACALCRVIAEEGGASFLVPHIPKLIECSVGENALTSGLDALSALAEAGEASAVAHEFSQLLSALHDKSSRFRAAACKTFVGICRGGSANLLQRLRLIETANASLIEGIGAKPMLESLVDMVENDPDLETRVAAAETLQCIVETDPESSSIVREKHSLPLFRAFMGYSSRINSQLRAALKATLGADDELEENDDWETPDSNESRNHCVICLLSLKAEDLKLLPCGHPFHRHCIQRWFDWKLKCKQKRSCPLCRWTEIPVSSIEATMHHPHVVARPSRPARIATLRESLSPVTGVGDGRPETQASANDAGNQAEEMSGSTPMNARSLSSNRDFYASMRDFTGSPETHSLASPVSPDRPRVTMFQAFARQRLSA